MTNIAAIERVHDLLWPGSSLVEKSRRLSKFSISEISAVDKPAQEGAVAVILKRDGVPRVETATPQKDERVRELEAREGKKKKVKRVKVGAVAKIVNETGETGCDPAIFFEALMKRAAKKRQEGETIEQAFTKQIVDDARGKRLYAALKTSSGQSRGADGFAYPAGADRRGMHDAPEAEAAGVSQLRSLEEARLDDLSRKYRNKHPDLSFEQAYSRVLETPDGKALFDRVRQASLVREMRGQGGIA